MDRERLVASARLVRQFVAEFQAEVLEIRRSPLAEALTQWTLTDDDYEELNEARKEIYALLETLNKGTLPEMMQDSKTKTITLSNVGRRFTVSHRLSCSMLDKEKGVEWLIANGGDAIPKLTVNAQTLSSFAKARIEKQGLDMPEDLFKVSTVSQVSATKV